MKIGLNLFLLSMMAAASTAEPSFYLYDADTGKWLDFLDYDDVDLDNFPNVKNYNIIFDRSGESAFLTMDDQPGRCEEKEPYTFFGDSGGYDSLYGKSWDSLELGFHSITGTQHYDLSGCRDGPDDYEYGRDFEVFDSGNCPGLALFLVFYDTEAQDDLWSVDDGDVICPPPKANIEMRFKICPNILPSERYLPPEDQGRWEIEKVSIELTGPVSASRTESKFPYFLWGDSWPHVYDGETLPDGSYTVTTFSAWGEKRSKEQEFTFKVDCSGPAERSGEFP